MYVTLLANDNDETTDSASVRKYAPCIATAFSHKLQEEIQIKMHSAQTMEVQ